MSIHHSSWAEQLPLINYRGLDWSKIRRTRYFCYQRFDYSYPGSIRNLHQRLVVVPPDRYGDQTVIDHDLTVAPHPAKAKQFTDAWGNRVWELTVQRVDRAISFESILTIERVRPIFEPNVPQRDVMPFCAPTRLTSAKDRITTVAHELAATTRDPEELAERISAWVSDVMSYGSGATGVQTPAAHALAIGKGLCQDYAHIMIAICRVIGLPARYVSGHMLADGGSHAWVDVLLPSTEDGCYRVVGFDPTNRRRPDMSYVKIAVGRDYSDVAPTSGSFSAPYSGKLSFHKRAGLSFVEFEDGDCLGVEVSGPPGHAHVPA